MSTERVTALIRGSRSLADLVELDGDLESRLRSEMALPDRVALVAAFRHAFDADGLRGLRVEKRRSLADVAARDLAGELSLEDVGGALSDIADACIQAWLFLRDAPADLAVISMGKLGARELNYVSDIDLIFVCDGDVVAATKACEQLLAELGGFSPEGQAYIVDTNLRPEGRDGPLVRSLDSCLEYYRRWAKPWEYQALMKARLTGGSASVGPAFVDETRALVFVDQLSADRVADIRRMKERVESHAAATARRAKHSDADDVKLGPGGIRDIEFSVQLLQLVHGAADGSVRAPATLSALSALAAGGYLAEEDAAGLSVAYRWLRTVEHRLQLRQERRVRRLPTRAEERAELAHSMGFGDSPKEGAAERFARRHGAVLADVRNRFERLFYRPMVETLAGEPGAGLSEDAIAQRLGLLGFRDTKRAATVLGGLVSGTSRRAKLFRVLSPAFLRWVSASPTPDQGLFAFLRLGEALEDRPDLLGALRENPPGLQLLARVLGSGRVLGDVLLHVPEEILAIADRQGPGRPKDRERLAREAVASLNWREPERRLDGLRRFKRREMLRVALADLAGSVDVGGVGRGLSYVAEACLEAALGQTDIPFGVIGMGKLGGRELSYASDIDVMFIHDSDAGEAERLAERLMAAIGEVTPEGQAFKIDAALRPEGKSGPLARSLDSYLEYYQRWANPWEHLALIKARPVAGDIELARKLVEGTRTYAFPERMPPEALTEIRHLKARMERERIPRGTDPRRNLKLGPGGLSDVEFAVQLVQFQHGHADPRMGETSTIEVLRSAAELELLDAPAADHLGDAYTWLSRLRNRLFLLVGRPQDVLPTKQQDLEALGIAMGFTDQPRQELEEAYLRITRRARRAAEELIYG